MFQYLQTLSLINENEQLDSVKISVSTSGYPLVSWIKTDSEAKFACFNRYDGSSWGFNDSNYLISPVTSFFNFEQIENEIYFLYSYRSESSSENVLAYKIYYTQTDFLSTETILDTGAIDYGLLFSFSTSPYFLYRKDGIFHVKNISGNEVFTDISNYVPVASNIYFSSGSKWLLFVWSNKSSSETVFKSRCFDLVSEVWEDEKNICTINSVVYDLSCCRNPDGDSPSPDVSYKPFYCSLVYRTNSSLICDVLEFDSVTDVSVSEVFSKNSVELQNVPSTQISVYGEKSIISLFAETLYLIRSDNIPDGYSLVSSPGTSVTSGLGGFSFVLSEDDVHYVYFTENIMYAYAPFMYGDTSIKRGFFVSDGGESYVNLNKISAINGYSFKDFIHDKNFTYPFGFVFSETYANNVFLFDVNYRRFIESMQVNISKVPVKIKFDRENSRLLILNNTEFISHDFILDEDTEYTSFNSVDLNTPSDFRYDDKEIFICDPENNRIIVLERTSLSYLRSISNNEIINPFQVVPSVTGELFVRAFSILNQPFIFRTTRTGTILNRYFSYDSFSLYSNIAWYFSDFSFSSHKIAFSFPEEKKVLCIDSDTGAFWEADLNSYSVYGCAVDESSGQVYVSVKNSSDVCFVIEFDGTTGLIIKSTKVGTCGVVNILEKNYKGIVGSIDLLKPEYSVEGQLSGSFNSVLDGLPFEVFNEKQNVETSYVAVDQEQRHTPNGFCEFDVWHFRNSGVKDAKISIDPNFSFTQSEDGSLFKSPVFCWDFNYDTYVDTFFVGSETYFKKIAIWRDEKTGDISLEQKGRIGENNKINSLYVFDGRVAVTAGGYLSVYSYDGLNRLYSTFVASDLVVHDYRFGYIWAASKSLSTVWKISPDLTTSQSFVCKDAVCKIEWSDFFSNFIVMGDNSLSYLSPTTGVVEVFYDVEDCFIDDMSVNGQNIALLVSDHKSIPVESDYETFLLFENAILSKRNDCIFVYSPLKKKYLFEKKMTYDSSVKRISFNGEKIICLVEKTEKIYVNSYGFLNGEETSFLYEGEGRASDIIELPIFNGVVCPLTDGYILSFIDGNSSVLSWKEGDAVERISVVSNGMLIKRSEVGRQTGSSSSSSSSSESGHQEMITIRVVVGENPGGSEKWDSGEIYTAKKCILYGGGNNLEPGQLYYVSIKYKNDSEIWSIYDTKAFIVPHFEFFQIKEQSSSSSSSNSVFFIENFYELLPDDVLNVVGTEEFSVFLNALSGQSASLNLNGTSYKIDINNDMIVFDSEGLQEYEFSFVGDSFILDNGSSTYVVILVGEKTVSFCQ